MSGPGLQEWFTLAELLPHVAHALPGSLRGLADHAEREGWRRDFRRCRLRPGKGGGREFHYTLFPAEVQARLIFVQAPPPPEAPEFKGRSKALWTVFERAPATSRLRAETRRAAVEAVHAVAGMTRAAAVAHVAAQSGVAASSLWSWLALVEDVARADWLAALLPRHVGRTATAPCNPAAWDALKADYLRPEGRNFESCYRRLLEAAEANGWSPIPSCKTLKRRMEREIPAAQRELARRGAEALRRMFPAQRRDRTIFRALEAMNADGHRADVFVRWEDGSIGRPILHVIQDLYSGTILAARVDRTENKEAVRLALADTVERWGIPERIWLDNGRQWASKLISGGVSTRYRFKVRAEEPEGILKALGITVHWTQPYSGQSKPIERAFRDFCEELSRHPSFAGAYTGNAPHAKPANYNTAAVPIAAFETVLRGEVERHNARKGRRSAVCGGTLSFRDALDKSLADAGTLVTRATPAQRRMLLLAAEAVSARKPDGAIHLMGSRYWADELLDHMGERLTVRFDPQDLAAPLAVYTLDNRFLCEAPAIGDVAFLDESAARLHARTRKDWLRHTRGALEAESRLSIEDYAALLPQAPAPDTPAPRAVRLHRRGGAAPAIAADPEATDEFRAGIAGLAADNVRRLRRDNL